MSFEGSQPSRFGLSLSNLSSRCDGVTVGLSNLASFPQITCPGLVFRQAPVMLSMQLQSSLMTIALVTDALAEYLTHPLEDVDNWYVEEDGLFDAEPGIADELEAIAA